MFCTTIPGSALLIDALAGVMGSPVGQTDRNDFVVASSSMVMFTDTDVAPAGTPLTPAMATSSVPPAFSVAAVGTPMGPPSVPRVSSTRTGGMPTKSEGAAGVGVWPGTRSSLSPPRAPTAKAPIATAPQSSSAALTRVAARRGLVGVGSWYDKGRSLWWFGLGPPSLQPARARTRRTNLWEPPVYPARRSGEHHLARPGTGRAPHRRHRRRR